MTAWNKNTQNDSERSSMLEYLFELSRKGKLRVPLHDLVPFKNYDLALKRAMPSQGMVGKKQILVF